MKKIKRSKITFTKLNQAGLDSPRQELFNGGLGIAVALPGFREFLCVHTGLKIQLYYVYKLKLKQENIHCAT